MPINANAEFLAHHGVPKQKWGERRYQNKDGSLTALGREHRRLTRPSRANSDTVTKKKPTLKEVYETKKKARAEKEQAKVEAKKQAAMEAETKRLAKQQEEVQAQKAAQEKYIAEAREKAMYTKDPKVLYDNMQYLNAAEAKAAKERMENILNVQKMIPKQESKWDKAMKNLDNLNGYYKTISTSASNVNKTLKTFGIDLNAELQAAMVDAAVPRNNRRR